LEVAIANKTTTEAERFEYYWGLISLATSQGWHDAQHKRFRVDSEGWNSRDAAQGQNAQLIRRQLGLDKKVIWIAHTSHTSHNKSFAEWWGVGDVRSGVYFFEQATGVKVFNTALTGYEFEEGKDVLVKPTAENSMDYVLHSRGVQYEYISSKSRFFRQFPYWWMQNENDAIGFPNGVLIRPEDHFDGYFYMDVSKAAVDAFPVKPKE
jgi:hypothetical protein